MIDTTFTWEVSPLDVFSTAKIRAALLDAVLKVLISYAPEIEGEMKDNAKWTDRTGNARQTLRCEAEILGEYATLYAIQHMNYGLFLETKNKVNPEIIGGGKYAIVIPTLTRYYRPVWADVTAVVK